jgi:hypothetical protein
VTASAAAAENIVDEHADLQGGEDTCGCTETEDIGGCASFCRRMFSKVPEPLLPRPASPQVVDVQKKASRSSTRGRRRTLAPTRSSLRLAARPSPVPVAQRAQRKLMHVSWTLSMASRRRRMQQSQSSLTCLDRNSQRRRSRQ